MTKKKLSDEEFTLFVSQQREKIKKEIYENRLKIFETDINIAIIKFKQQLESGHYVKGPYRREY